MKAVSEHSQELQAYAERYIERGLAPTPVPIDFAEASFEGLTDLHMSEETVPKHFGRKMQNIGVLTGEPSGWQVCVELRTPETRAAADMFLPQTQTSGRSSVHRCQLWYLSPAAETESWDDTDGSTLLELRSTGAQSLVAPSIHPDGCSCRWNWVAGVKVAEVPPRDLRVACRDAATAALLARRVPAREDRRRYALCLAGHLLQPGRLDEEAALSMVLGVWQAAGIDGEKSLGEVEDIVRDTARKLRGGEGVPGDDDLEEMAPGVPKLLERWWGWGQKHESRGPEPQQPEEKADPWPKLPEEALHGLPGEIVKAIEPHTEADPAALLVNLLSAVGNAAGRGAHFRVEADDHHLKINAVLVGETSKGRKGTSWSYIVRLMKEVDPDWVNDNVENGLASGEGLIHRVRDPKMGVDKDGNEIVLDAGVFDKRLMVVEGEFARVLKVMDKNGNILSQVIRECWDGESLQTMSKGSPEKAKEPHITVLGHVTKAELLKLLDATETANGFGNRFLFIMVRRSKVLPLGGDFDVKAQGNLVGRLKRALAFAKGVGKITWGESALAAWKRVYGPLSEGEPGLFGAITGRAEAQVVRLAALYAVMDCSRTIEHEHLVAALALWGYAEDSARYLFGGATGDADGDKILDALKKSGEEGMTRTEIRDLFGRNTGATRIDRALEALFQDGKARREDEATGGRPAVRWFTAEDPPGEASPYGGARWVSIAKATGTDKREGSSPNGDGGESPDDVADGRARAAEYPARDAGRPSREGNGLDSRNGVGGSASPDDLDDPLAFLDDDRHDFVW